MGCKGGEVTSDHKEKLKLLEKMLSYPPRFRLKFQLEEDIIAVRSQNVSVRINGVQPPTTDTITLEITGICILCLSLF